MILTQGINYTMDITSSKNIITELLNKAGIDINGQKPWDLQVHNDDFYNRVLRDYSLGLGESYIDGWWSCEKPDQFFDRMLSGKLTYQVKQNLGLKFRILAAKLFNLQTKQLSLDVGKQHYDLGNDLFKNTLDKNLNYTCGFWETANNLDDAQIHKMDLTCQKLFLKPGMRVLDIGCGFGSLAKYAAEHYGAKVVGVTISQQQYEYAKENCRDLPVEIRFQDYRDVNETFDRVVSLGMFEHVGHLNYATYMDVVHRNLEDDGLFLLHTIGSNQSVVMADPWITKYIFPHGMLPSISQIGKAIEKRFIMEDWHNFGADYDKTLMAWYKNFNANWEQLKNKYNDRFRRMWNYYLLSCAGAFRAREMQLWQIVLSKKGVRGGYSVTRPYFQVAEASQSFAKSRDSFPQ